MLKINWRNVQALGSCLLIGLIKSGPQIQKLCHDHRQKLRPSGCGAERTTAMVLECLLALTLEQFIEI